MPYRRHSVWIDVFGVVLFGLVLLGGAGYLLSNMGGMTGGSGGGGVVAGGDSAPAPRAESGLQAQRSAPASRSPSIIGEGAPAPNGSGAEAPFSDGWQEQATPNLTGPTGSGAAGPSGAPSGSGAIGRAPSEGPIIASRRPQGGVESRSAQTRGEGSAWRSEARKLSGRVRALSNQLGQMEREGRAVSDQAAKPSRKSPEARTASGQGRASTSSDPATPQDPSQVPIGDHLHWLAGAGILWGAWRIGRGT